MSLSIRDLLEAGAHFGHQTHRWNPKMKPYIWGDRNGIYIINLEVTMKLWKRAEEAVIRTVKEGKKVLFVGTKAQAQDVVEEESKRCEQYFVNRRWLGGMLTNFRTIRSRVDRLETIERRITEQADRLSKKEIGRLNKERQKLEKSLSGIRALKGLPGLVVVVDPNKEHIAVKEARKLNIPILSITDTNCDPEGIDYLVPANDDALKSVSLFMHAVADACLTGSKEYEKRIQEETQRRMELKKQKEAEEAAAKAAAPPAPSGKIIVEMAGSTGDRSEPNASSIAAKSE